MLQRSIVLTAALLAIAAMGGTAQARTITAKSVESVDGKTSCYGTLPSAGRGIVCTSDRLPDGGEVDSYVGLLPRGKAKLGQRGDYVGYPGRPAKARTGDRWTWHGITCVFGSRRVTCRNPGGHGFRIGVKGFVRLP